MERQVLARGWLTAGLEPVTGGGCLQRLGEARAAHGEPDVGPAPGGWCPRPCWDAERPWPVLILISSFFSCRVRAGMHTHTCTHMHMYTLTPKKVPSKKCPQEPVCLCARIHSRPDPPHLSFPMQDTPPGGYADLGCVVSEAGNWGRFGAHDVCCVWAPRGCAAGDGVCARVTGRREPLLPQWPIFSQKRCIVCPPLTCSQFPFQS